MKLNSEDKNSTGQSLSAKSFVTDNLIARSIFYADVLIKLGK